MKPKKNPKTDLNRNRGLYFVMGLATVMALAYVALEWKSYDTTFKYDTALNIDPLLDEEVPLIDIKLPPPPKPPAAPTEIDIVDDEDPIEETVIETTETDDEQPILEVDDVDVVEEVIDEEVPFSVIENVPVFPGCENETDKKGCFQSMMQKHIRKHFRYPEIAQDMGVEGRVSTMFVIQKDGSIGSIQMRGPDKNLEKEAARILSKLPKMTPGKQRGRAVRVPFSIPITFKLQ
ncbi:energy transducer TonB [Aggregatimonas sangjinii]|uniref:Energy transducer TonB n=1 Tax=Aggregatimonas sangjinii TaxID=2583587 RepID=A0A5B7SK49_9FLAO|nr:energy transducer TonB [Aggregatimonas sangjinii]QCW98955.1 energy transducer TonB [Aggregatimonas sangjinii]